MLRQAIFAHKPQVFLRRVQKGRDPFVPDRVKPALASLEKGQILRILRSGPVAQPVRRLQDLLCRIAAAVNVDFVSRIWAASLRRSRPRWIRAASDPKRRELRPGLSGACPCALMSRMYSTASPLLPPLLRCEILQSLPLFVVMIKPNKRIITDREGFPSAEQAVSFRQLVPFYPEQLH